MQRMTLDIMSSLNLDQVLQNVLTYLGQVIRYDSVCLFLLKDDGVYPIASKGFEDQDEILDALFESKLIAELQRVRQPIVVADVQTDLRFKPPTLYGAHSRLAGRSVDGAWSVHWLPHH